MHYMKFASQKRSIIQQQLIQDWFQFWKAFMMLMPIYLKKCAQLFHIWTLKQINRKRAKGMQEKK